MEKYNFQNTKSTEIICILDASGSMEANTLSTISGFNEFLQSQKAKVTEYNVNSYLTLITFNDTKKVLFNRMDIKEVPELNAFEYKAQGCTALYDTLGDVLSKCKDFHKENYNGSNVIVMVMTDGMENTSKNWTKDSVKNIIESCKEVGWKFIFMGTNFDSFEAGNQIGLKGMSVSYSNDRAGYAQSWKLMNDCVNCVYTSGSMDLSKNVAKYSNVSNEVLL